MKVSLEKQMEILLERWERMPKITDTMAMREWAMGVQSAAQTIKNRIDREIVIQALQVKKSGSPKAT